MLVRHLMVGLLAGVMSVLVGGLTGFSMWALLGFYVLGANLGLGLSVLAGLVTQGQGSARVPVGQVPGIRGENLPLAE
jgi:hypothetical protein